jgi:uncharacterized protein YggE
MMKSMLKTILLAATTLVLLILGTSFLSQTGRAQPARQTGADEAGTQRTVSVTGAGRVSAQPDQATVRLGVQTEAESAADALAENSERMQALLEALRDAGVQDADIQTQTLQLFPRYEQPVEGAAPALAGYTATNIVEARLRALDDLGAVLDAAVAAGGNSIDSIRFEVSDPAEALDQGRAAAMEDAQHKAEQLATLAGAELGEVLTISEATRTPPPVFEAAPAADERVAVPIEPGAQTVEVEVQVTWLLR